MILKELNIKIIEYNSPQYWEAIKLRSKVLREPLNMKFTDDQLKAESPYIHIAAYEDSRIVGCMYLIVTGDQGRLKQFAVEPDLQKKGIGKALAVFAEQYCKEMGVKLIIIHARDYAVNFYEKLGYICYDEEFLEIGISHRKMKKKLATK